MYCTECGNPIETSAPFCAHCGQPQQINTPQRVSIIPPALCPNCLAQLADGMLFCTNCGAHIKTDSSASAASPDSVIVAGELSWKTILLGTMAGLLLTAVLTPLVLFLRTRVSASILNPAANVSIAPSDHESMNATLESSATAPVENLAEVTVTASETVEPIPTLPFNIIRWNETRDTDALLLATFSECLQQEPPWGCTHTAVEFPVNTTAILASGWCASDAQILEANLSVMTLELIVDGFEIALDNTLAYEKSYDEMICLRNSAILQGWSAGEHHVRWTRSFKESVDDGFDLYPAGSYISDFQIDVVDRSRAELEDMYAAREGVQVELLDGNALEFNQPPALIAFANDEHTAPPAAVQLAPLCLNSCYRYHQWLGMTMPGESYEVIYSGVTGTLGVQLWGNQNDGVAYVFVDDELLWEGNTAGTDSNYPGGAFVKYLQITGLDPVANHILRVETSTDGGAVTIYFFGFSRARP